VHTPDDPIELTQTESEAISEGEAPLGGVDRRTFITLSLAATAASTLGGDTVRAQAAGVVPVGRGQAAQQPPPRIRPPVGLEWEPDP